MADSGKHIYQKIKESFDKIERKAPEGLWNGISQSASLTSDESLIQESFEKVERKAPSNSWETVKKQVIIDEVWENISLDQDRRKRRVIWLWFAGSASIVTLLILSTVFYSSLTSSSKDQRSITSKTQSKSNSQEKISTDKKSVENTNSKNGFEESSNVSNQSDDSNGSIVSNNRNVSNNISVNQQYNTPQFSILQFGTPSENLIVENDSSRNERNELLVNQHVLIEKDFSDTTLPLLGLDLFPETKAELIIDSNFEFSPKPLKRFEVGIVMGIGNSWVFNNDVKNGFNSNSLVQNRISEGFNLGLIFDYNLNRRSAIELVYDVYSVHTSKYRSFEDGRLIDHNIQLNQQKITLDYKYRLLKNGTFVVKGGGYFAHSIKEKTWTNSVKFTPLESFESFDYGLNIGIGSEHQFNALKVEYGLKSDIGLYNITSGSSILPKKFDYASTFIIGAYVSVRYLF